MEGDFHKLKPAPSFKRRFDPPGSTSVSRAESETDLPTYTSLKDIILMNSSPKHPDQESSANIAIRNELVKHAASAYVLSATVINPASREQDLFHEMWERVRASCCGSRSCWRVYGGGVTPLRDLCGPVVRLFVQIFHRIRNGFRGRVEIIWNFDIHRSLISLSLI